MNTKVECVYTIDYHILKEVITDDELDDLFPEVCNDTYVKFYLDQDTDLGEKVAKYLFNIGVPEEATFVLINFSW
jgi:hypothetical protein